MAPIPIPELQEYLAALPTMRAKEDFAKRCGTSIGFLKLVALGHKRGGESLAINIDRETKGFVRCEKVRPDVDFDYLRGTAKRRERAAARVAPRAAR